MFRLLVTGFPRDFQGEHFCTHRYRDIQIFGLCPRFDHLAEEHICGATIEHSAIQFLVTCYKWQSLVVLTGTKVASDLAHFRSPEPPFVDPYPRVVQ
jgi:hypothetical protein